AGAMISVFGFYVFLVIVWGRKHRPKTDLHGSAHWATEAEVRETGLLPPLPKRRFGLLPGYRLLGKGVYVGAWQDRKNRIHYLRHNGPEHILAFAPTRSGKGIGLVLPTLLSWPHSTVVLDIKGENWALTSGWRQSQAQNLVLKFDPAAPPGHSVKFNPLDEIRLGTNHCVSDVQNIVTMIVDPDGSGLNDHWAKTGHALLVGAVLHALSKAKASHTTATLKSVADMLSDPARPIDALFDEMIQTDHPEPDIHDVIAASAQDMKNKADNEKSGVLSTAMSFLTLYRDPIVARNTEVSEFSIRDLMHHAKPVSLYIVVPPSDKDRLKPLVRLLINQIVRTLTEEMTFAGGASTLQHKHRLLLMLDEFPSLGKLDIFQESLAFIAGYGLKAYLIVQDLSQLYAAYSKDEAIMSNCHIRIAYAPNKIETAELLSKMSHIPLNLVVRRFRAAPIASRRQDLQVEHPVRCRDVPTFDFHPIQACVLGPPLVRNQVVEMCQTRQKRRLTPIWMMEVLHRE
ncbi:MAG: type IV secretory system conjugative DNA transfer family protein, partial [Candidatus Tectomicrobia bacterium]|nr:type IV secretory system conjugative DNA transfer family protein [Candidatus Tectomicrobia bacterium]